MNDDQKRNETTSFQPHSLLKTNGAEQSTVHDCKLSLCLTTSLTCCAHGELELFVQESQLLAHVFKSYSL